MRVDLALYTVHLKTIKGMLENRVYTTPREIVSEMALATQCPVIVVLHYVAHLTSMTPELEESIKRVKEFYQIKEIIGWPLAPELGTITV